MNQLENTNQSANNQSEEPAILSYKDIRRAIGWLGIMLPIVLMAGSILGHYRIQPSISHYYYTSMREIFEGTLFAVSLFLFSYKGFDRRDSAITNLAGLFCIGVALFQTDIIDGYSGQQPAVYLINSGIHSSIHLGCAALFFFTLAYMSISQFTKTKGIKTPEKIIRNRIYRACGIVMIVCVLCLGVYFIAKGNPMSHIVIICETIALLAFGFSWLIKGETLFRD